MPEGESRTTPRRRERLHGVVGGLLLPRPPTPGVRSKTQNVPSLPAYGYDQRLRLLSARGQPPPGGTALRSPRGAFRCGASLQGRRFDPPGPGFSRGPDRAGRRLRCLHRRYRRRMDLDRRQERESPARRSGRLRPHRDRGRPEPQDPGHPRAGRRFAGPAGRGAAGEPAGAVLPQWTFCPPRPGFPPRRGPPDPRDQRGGFHPARAPGSVRPRDSSNRRTRSPPTRSRRSPPGPVHPRRFIPHPRPRRSVHRPARRPLRPRPPPDRASRPGAVPGSARYPIGRARRRHRPVPNRVRGRSFPHPGCPIAVGLRGR